MTAHSAISASTDTRQSESASFGRFVAGGTAFSIVGVLGAGVPLGFIAGMGIIVSNALPVHATAFLGTLVGQVRPPLPKNYYGCLAVATECSLRNRSTSSLVGMEG